jgi:hypothetical protein
MTILPVFFFYRNRSWLKVKKAENFPQVNNFSNSTFHYFVSFSMSDMQGGSNMTGTNCDLFTYKSSRSYLNHLVFKNVKKFKWARKKIIN